MPTRPVLLDHLFHFLDLSVLGTVVILLSSLLNDNTAAESAITGKLSPISAGEACGSSTAAVLVEQGRQGGVREYNGVLADISQPGEALRGFIRRRHSL